MVRLRADSGRAARAPRGGRNDFRCKAATAATPDLIGERVVGVGRACTLQHRERIAGTAAGYQVGRRVRRAARGVVPELRYWNVPNSSRAIGGQQSLRIDPSASARETCWSNGNAVGGEQATIEDE
jgi:hypothetical protein